MIAIGVYEVDIKGIWEQRANVGVLNDLEIIEEFFVFVNS